MRIPAAVHEFGRFTLPCDGRRLAHVASSRVRYPRSCAVCATGVQGAVLVLTTVTRGCSFPTACIPPSPRVAWCGSRVTLPFGQGGIGVLGPDERFAALVPAVDEAADGLDE